MKKSKIILSTLMPVAAVAATAGIAVSALSLTSCSSTGLVPTINNYQVNLKNKPTNTRTTQNEGSTTPVDRPTILPEASTQKVDDTVIDANFNQNPFVQMQDKFGNNIRGLIESDVNDVVLEFLSCMEHEEKNGNKGELELELVEKEDMRKGNPIVITNAAFDSDFLTTKKITVTANVYVEYEYEKNGREQEGAKWVNGVTFDLYAEFAGRDEILGLTQRVSKKKSEVHVNGKEADFEDIMELLVGERDKDPFDFDFDDILGKKDSSIDEIGLLKFMSNYNDLISSDAKMFGYSFDVLEFWNNLTRKWNEQNTNMPKRMLRAESLNKSDFYFWAPSTAVCNIFEPELNNGTDLNGSVQKIIDEYKNKNGFNGLKDEVTGLVNNNADNYKAFRDWLEKFNINFPKEVTFKNIRLENEIDYSSSQGKIIKKLEVKIYDQFGNKYEIEFYSNWWGK